MFFFLLKVERMKEPHLNILVPCRIYREGTKGRCMLRESMAKQYAIFSCMWRKLECQISSLLVVYLTDLLSLGSMSWLKNCSANPVSSIISIRTLLLCDAPKHPTMILSYF